MGKMHRNDYMGLGQSIKIEVEHNSKEISKKKCFFKVIYKEMKGEKYTGEYYAHIHAHKWSIKM